jgi:O-antigen/teichoic acid export membrane protein
VKPAPVTIHPKAEEDPLEPARAASVRIGRGTAITWGAWVVARALALATLLLLTRALPADDLGALFAAMATGLLGAMVATGGLPDATTRSAVSAVGESGFGRGDLNGALLRFGAACPAILILLFAIAGQEGGRLDLSLLVASVLLAVTQGGTAIIASIFRARGQAGRYALVTSLIASIGRALVAAAALEFDLGASIVLWAFAAVNAAIIAGTWKASARGLPASRSRSDGEGALHIGGAVWSLLSNLDVVVVGVVLGAGGAGTYGATMRLAEANIQFVIAIAVLYLPEATRLAVAGHRRALADLYRTSSRWSALVSLFTTGVGFIAAPDLAKILFPDRGSTIATLLRILFLGYAVYGALGLAYGTSIAQGAFREIRAFGLISLPLLVVVTVAFTELWGLTGAACATASGYVVLTFWWAMSVRATLGVTPIDRFYRRSLAACCASWASAGVAAYLTRADAPVIALGATVAAGFVTWVALLLLAGALRPAEMRAVGRLRIRDARPRRASSG